MGSIVFEFASCGRGVPMALSAQVVAFPEPVRKSVLVVGENAEVKRFFDSDFLSDEVSLEFCSVQAAALERLAVQPYDLVISCGEDEITDDIDLFCRIQSAVLFSFKVIIVAPPATPSELIDAMRSHVFSVFSTPFDPASLADMIELATNVPLWTDGIFVASAKPDWIALRVRCSRVTAERLVQFGKELNIDVDESTRDAIMAAFRELLLNAMEHGAKFDPNLKVDVGYLRTPRLILYYLRDPGMGFDLPSLDHSVLNNPRDDPMRHLAIRVEKGLRAGGFGIHLAKELMDEMVYNDLGNEVVILKYQ
jgi:anti-sigma regulatory factor (Ser/Thr protein kinase)/CheY-like chemotaxis protein